MSKQIPIPLGGPSPEEAARIQNDAAAAALENLRTQVRNETQREFVDLIHELSEPDRSMLPAIDRSPERGAIEVRSPMMPLYRRLPEAEREWRNPDSDHYMAEWLRGLVARDHARVLLAEEKLRGMFGRADALEGTAGTAGGFSTGTGGVLVPRPMEAIVMIARDRIAKARRFFTIYQMSAQTHYIPTAKSMTAAMVAEATSSAQGEPVFGSVALTAKVACVKAVASRELLRDSAYNLVSIFATRGGMALGALEDTQVFNSPAGANDITALSGTAYAETATFSISYTDMLAMYYNVPQQYRDGSIWLASSDVLQKLSNVRDVANGRPIYQGLSDVPGPITDDPGAVGVIFRKRVYEVPFTAGSLWFGDPMMAYAFGDRQGIEVDVSEHALFTNRQVMWLLTERIAGNNVDASASQYAVGLTGTFTSS